MADKQDELKLKWLAAILCLIVVVVLFNRPKTAVTVPASNPQPVAAVQTGEGHLPGSSSQPGLEGVSARRSQATESVGVEGKSSAPLMGEEAAGGQGVLGNGALPAGTGSENSTFSTEPANVPPGREEALAAVRQQSQTITRREEVLAERRERIDQVHQTVVAAEQGQRGFGYEEPPSEDPRLDPPDDIKNKIKWKLLLAH